MTKDNNMLNKNFKLGIISKGTNKKEKAKELMKSINSTYKDYKINAEIFIIGTLEKYKL